MSEETRRAGSAGLPEDKAVGLSDSQLLRDARRGDAGAFDQLVNRHGPALFRLAAALVGQAADAEDVLQETFLGAYEGLANFQERASVKTWLTPILVRQAARFHRRRQVRWTLPLDAAAGGQEGQALDGPSDPALATPAGQAAADARMDLAGMLAELSHEHREIVVLREIEGLSYDEISEVLKLPRGTVESRPLPGRETLRREHGGAAGTTERRPDSQGGLAPKTSKPVITNPKNEIPVSASSKLEIRNQKSEILPFPRSENMNPCEHLPTASAYHDGELTGEARATFERHLGDCEACARELEELRAVSRRLAAARAGLPELSATALARVHRVIERRRSADEIAPMARRLAAIAATILVACSLWLFTQRTSPPQASTSAVALDIENISLLSDPTTASASPETQLAKLIATDLGGSHD